ncbi:MAG TPA: peptide deformylase [Solirubrobacterales bacterium]|nr:peptide deformylase [Solirubrobacterales bacterium]
MAVREVLLYPDPALKQVALPAQADQAERVGNDLMDTMRAFPGCVGLAAPQLGELVRVVVIDLTGHRRVPDPSGPLVLINPRVRQAHGTEVAREGCLSIPELTANVRRATEIEVEHAGGRLHTTGFEARCVLHELDHLDGILFLDRVESLSEDLFRRKTRE